jgi:hypothetical protein
MTAAAAGDDGSMGRALAAGLPADVLAVLMAARANWRAENEGRSAVPAQSSMAMAAEALWERQLDEALTHPLASSYDDVFLAAMRRSRRA